MDAAIEFKKWFRLKKSLVKLDKSSVIYDMNCIKGQLLQSR